MKYWGLRTSCAIERYGNGFCVELPQSDASLSVYLEELESRSNCESDTGSTLFGAGPEGDWNVDRHQLDFRPH